jgi:5-bromo-4-chloroindolyl phosphate hydrolysis protein
MKTLRWFISAAISSGIFSVLFVVVDAGTLISALLGGAAFAGGALLFAPEKIDPSFAAAAKDIGIDPKQIKGIISGGKKKIKLMKGFIDKIDDAEINTGIVKVAGTAENIFRNFQKDPKDIKAARQFITYYMDAVINVLQQYSAIPEGAAGRKDFRKKVIELLNTANTSFEKQLARLYEDDYLNLASEMSVLEKTLKSEGMM